MDTLFTPPTLVPTGSSFARTSGATGTLHDKARKVATDFESQVLSVFTEAMFAGVDTQGPFGGGHAERIFRSLMNEQYASQLAKAGGIGIADNVYREILKLQETAP